METRKRAGNLYAVEIMSGKSKTWYFQLSLLCFILGLLVALSLKTQRQAVDEGVPQRWPALRDEFVRVKRENETLQKDAAEYKQRYETMAKNQAAGLSSTKGLRDSLDEAKLLAGTVKVTGKGIVVTLTDSPKLDPNEDRPDVTENYMVHDSDISNVVNELFAAGAEAIAVNDQRFIASTSVRCVGPAIMVNSKELAPPYIIKAIGDPKVMEEALHLPMGVADGLLLLDMIKIEKKSDIEIPAYNGSTHYNYAKKKE